MRPCCDLKPVLPVLGTGLVNWNNRIVRIRDRPLAIKTACERNIDQYSERRVGKIEPMTTLIKLYRIETPEPKWQPKLEEREGRFRVRRPKNKGPAHSSWRPADTRIYVMHTLCNLSLLTNSSSNWRWIREFDLGTQASETVSLGKMTGAATHFGAIEGTPEAC